MNKKDKEDIIALLAFILLVPLFIFLIVIAFGSAISLSLKLV